MLGSKVILWKRQAEFNVKKDELVDILKNDAMEIVFTKKDGSERTMTCSLQKEFLPAINSDAKIKKENFDVLNVFDLDINEWRAITLKNILSIEKANYGDCA